MSSRYEATLNQVTLSSLDSSIYVYDIQYSAPDISTQVMAAAKRPGAIVTDRRQEKTTVTILFEIRKYSIADRQTVCQKITKWAMNGNLLEVNDRSGQQLHVICAQPPVIDSAMRWLNQLSVVFEAYDPPYWEAKNPTTKTLTGSDVDDTIIVPGNCDYAPVDVTITPSSTLTSISVYAGDTHLTLTGISVTSSQSIVISHDDHGFLQIMQGSTSLINKRTGSDDLLVKSGNTEVLSVSADVSVTALFSVRGYSL